MIDLEFEASFFMRDNLGISWGNVVNVKVGEFKNKAILERQLLRMAKFIQVAPYILKFQRMVKMYESAQSRMGKLRFKISESASPFYYPDYHLFLLRYKKNKEWCSYLQFECIKMEKLAGLR